MNNMFSGTGVALVTPFTTNGQVDFDALGKLVESVIAGGVNYLVALGTTAETPTLTAKEKDLVVECIKKHNHTSLPLMVGIGGNNTLDIVERIKTSGFDGIDALLSVTPYYNRPSQAGLYQHYKAISEVSPVPVMLYNVPSRTGINLDAATTVQLSRDCKNILGVKDASANIPQLIKIVRDTPDDFLVISGDDGMAIAQIACGAKGVISVAANAFPQEVSKMIAAALQNDFTTAAKMNCAMAERIDNLFAEGNPVGVKAALAAQGKMSASVRLPLIQASDALIEKFR